MSLCTLETTMARIRVATTESPVAVFTSSELNLMEVVFAGTVSAMKRLATDPRLIGVFDKTMDPGQVRARIRRSRPGPGSLRCPAGPVRITHTDPMME